MGKGQIIANLGDGEYTVKCLYNRTQITAMLARLNDQISAAETLIGNYETEKTNLESDLSDIADVIWNLNVELSYLQSNLSGLQAELTALQITLSGYQAEVTALQNQIDGANNSIAGLNDQIDDAETHITELQAQAGALQDEIDALPDGPEKEAKQAELDAIQLEITELEEAIPVYQSTIGTLESQIELWEGQITSIEDNDIAPQEIEVAAKQKEVSDKQTEINEKTDEINAKTSDKLDKTNDIAKQQALIDGKNLYITGLEKRKEVLTNLPEDPIVGAWCADLTDDLSGDVATIEPFSQFDYEKIQIRPGYDNRHVWNADRDGQLQFVKGMTSAQTFYNLAMHPGWQVFMPTYRIGEITSIDRSANTCNVTIDVTRSKNSIAGPLTISGWSPYLTGISIEYMSCNNAAFEVGDRVVVEYRNRSASEDETPVVIGFESEPKPCGAGYGKIQINGTDLQTDQYFYVLKITDTDGGFDVVITDRNGIFKIPHGFSDESEIKLWCYKGRMGMYFDDEFEDLSSWDFNDGLVAVVGDGTCLLGSKTPDEETPDLSKLGQYVSLYSNGQIDNHIYFKTITVHEISGTLVFGPMEITTPGTYTQVICNWTDDTPIVRAHLFSCEIANKGYAVVSSPAMWDSGKVWNLSNPSVNVIVQLFDDTKPITLLESGYYTDRSFDYYIEQEAIGTEIAEFDLITEPMGYGECFGGGDIGFNMDFRRGPVTGPLAAYVSVSTFAKRCRYIATGIKLKDMAIQNNVSYHGAIIAAYKCNFDIIKVVLKKWLMNQPGFCPGGDYSDYTYSILNYVPNITGYILPQLGFSGLFEGVENCNGTNYYVSGDGVCSDYVISKCYIPYESPDYNFTADSFCIFVSDDNGLNAGYQNAKAYFSYIRTAYHLMELNEEGESVGDAVMYPGTSKANLRKYEWQKVNVNSEDDPYPV